MQARDSVQQTGQVLVHRGWQQHEADVELREKLALVDRLATVGSDQGGNGGAQRALRGRHRRQVSVAE